MAGVLAETPLFSVDTKFTSRFLNEIREPEMLNPSIYLPLALYREKDE
jgi:hypothetical protein